MDDRYAPQPITRWFSAAAIVSLLFMLVGCVGYLLEVMADPASLPLDQRAVHEALPLWLISANAVAVWAGAAGALMLVLRRKLAEPLLLAPGLRDLISTGDIAVAVVVTVITWTIYWFARHSRQRGWLR